MLVLTISIVGLILHVTFICELFTGILIIPSILHIVCIDHDHTKYRTNKITLPADRGTTNCQQLLGTCNFCWKKFEIYFLIEYQY